MAIIEPSGPCQQITTTWGQVLIFLSFLINVYFQRKDKNTLEKKVEVSQQAVVVETKKALTEQTEELKKAARTRLSDLGKQFDSLLTEDRRRRREDDGPQ